MYADFVFTSASLASCAMGHDQFPNTFTRNDPSSASVAALNRDAVAVIPATSLVTVAPISVNSSKQFVGTYSK